MSEHYYSPNPTSEHRIRRFTAEMLGRELSFFTDSGVFSRDGVDPGTRLLIESLPDIRGRFLDLACGWGPVGIAAAAAYPDAEVVMTDVNERAVELSRRAAEANRVDPLIVSGDGFASVEGTFDCIAVNPPIRAGKAVIYDMFRESISRLNPGGTLYIVIRKQQGAESALKYLRTLVADVEVVNRGGGYWIIRAAAEG